MRKLALCLCFLGLLILSGCDGKPKSDEEFLSGVRTSAETAAPGSSTEAGIVPAMDGSDVRLPKIVPETTHYVIQVPTHEPGHATLKISNEGDAPLEIRSVTTSCQCTQGSMEQQVIPPGGETNLKISVNPYGVRGFTTTKVLTLMSNDPVKPILDIEVESFIDPEVSIEPEEFDFGILGKGEERTLTMHFRQVNDEPLELTDIALDTASPHLRLSYERLPESAWQTAGKAEYEVSATLLSTMPAGKHRLHGRISTNLKRLNQYSLWLNAEVTP